MWRAGDKLGRFVLEKEIGQGSHGVVFVARDTALDTPVAVKILHPWLTQDTAVRDRFKRELLLARRISHQGVCRLFDLHEDGEAFFITMEFVEGPTLLTVLKNEGRLQPLRAVRILRGVCQALQAAHAAGVVHRDLKPANIIIRAGDQPMILDFGTATAQDVSRVTRPGTAVGSMRFIAPEVFSGTSPSARTDVYSLGVVSYVSLAGKLPYNAAAGAIEMLELIKNQPPVRLDNVQPDIPKELADVVAHAMNKDADARFQSARELDEALGVVEKNADPAAALPSRTKEDFARWAPSVVVREAIVEAQTGKQTPVKLNEEKPPPVTDPQASLNTMSQAGVTVVTPSPFANEQTKVSPVQFPFAAGSDSKKPELTLEGPEPESSMLSSLGAPGATDVNPAPRAISMDTAVTAAPDVDSAALENAMDAAFGDAAPADTTTEGTEDEAATKPAMKVMTLPERDVTVRVARPLDPNEMGGEFAGVTSEAPADNGGNRTKLIAAAVGVILVIAIGAFAVSGGDDVPSVDAGTDGVAALADAGTASGDAGAIVEAVVDAGSDTVAIEGDAGPEKNPFDFVEEGEAEPEPPPTGTGNPRPPPRRSPVVEAIRAMNKTMFKKGFIPGDVPTAEATLKRAWAARERERDGLDLVKDAGKIVESQNVDRAFVLGKLGRFNTKYAAAKKKNPKIEARVEPVSRAAADAFQKGQFGVANAKLNQAFALMAR